MNSTLTHDVGALMFEDASVNRTATKPGNEQPARPEPPTGYRWVSRRWRVLPDGTRDYAAYHGKTAFSELLPVSSRLRSTKR